MDYLPRPYVPYRTAYRPIISAGRQQINLDDDTFLQLNPVVGILLPSLNYGTDRVPEGVTIDATIFGSATLTLYSKQELILDTVPLRTFVPTNNAQQIPYLFTEPIVIDFTRSFLRDNSGSATPWGAAGRVIPLQYFYMPAADFADREMRRRIADVKWQNEARQLGLLK